jgi:hypothetical protein
MRCRPAIRIDFDQCFKRLLLTQSEHSVSDPGRGLRALLALLSFAHRDRSHIGTADQRRIAAALETLRWRRERPDGKTDWQGKRWWVPAN